MTTARAWRGILLIVPLALVDPAHGAARQGPARTSPEVEIWLEAGTAARAPGRIASPVGLVLQQLSVVRTDHRTTMEAVLFLAELEGGKLLWQAESAPFRLEPGLARRGAGLGRLLPGGPAGGGFATVRDRVATHYARANGAVSASAVASSPAEVVLGAVFDHVPRSVPEGRVLLVAVLPAAPAQRLSAPVRPMLVGGL